MTGGGKACRLKIRKPPSIQASRLPRIERL
jgi:hypothetical protein